MQNKPEDQRVKEFKPYLLEEYHLVKGVTTLTFRSGKTIPDVMITLGYSNDPNVKVVYFDNIRRDWQLPLSGTKDVGNPKRKEMSTDEFNNTFEEHEYWYKELKPCVRR